MTEWSEGDIHANGITIHYHRTGGNNKPSILLLHGITGDPGLHAIVTPKVAQEAAQLWKNGEVMHISGAGHSIHRDRYNETMAAVRAFLHRE
jgi:pimeloyl-ACP methyl ester carboxylesterase